jgi:hypothetical protein
MFRSKGLSMETILELKKRMKNKDMFSKENIIKSTVVAASLSFLIYLSYKTRLKNDVFNIGKQLISYFK